MAESRRPSATGPAARPALVVLLLAVLLVAAAPASALTRKQATSRALAALGSKKASGPVVVFALRKPLRAGSRVTQEGSRKTVARVGRERAFFFYQDGAPFEPYPHPGRVALVGARTGKVKLSRTITRRPIVNGRLAAFLRSAKAYGSPLYRVFDSETRGKGSKPEEKKPEPPPEPPPPLVPDPLDVPDLNGNFPPKADSQDLIVKQGFSKRITLTGTDRDDDLLTFHIVQEPLRGTVTGTPPEVVYTPEPGYLGPDNFGFKARDDDKDSNVAQIRLSVVPLGQPPVVTTSAGCTAYVEQAPAVVIDGQIAVSDPDDTVLDSARVRIASGAQDGDDLLFTDQNGIVGTYDQLAGVLTLTGTATVATYQAALSSVRYRNLSSGNASATKDVEFIVNDAGNDSAPVTKQVCVTGGAGGDNDKPTGEPGEGALQYIENDGPVSVDGSFVVGDPDSPNLSGATVKFVPFVTQPVDEEGEPTGPPVSTITFTPTEDELGFTDQNGITGSYDDETGVLTLTGSASVAHYEEAIRSVTYENSSEDPSDATRRMQFQVTDSQGANSTPTRRDIFVTPVNDAPEVQASEGTEDYTGSPTVVDPGLVAIDVDDDDLESATVSIATGFVTGDELVFVDQLGISGTYDTGTGVLTLTGTAPVADYETALRSVAYDHPGGTPTGARTVEFLTNDGELDSAPSAKNFEINDKPVLDASDAGLAYTENEGPVAADPGLTATDVDSASLAGATVAISAGFVEAEDELAFVENPEIGITGAYDDTTGVLTLSGAASVADYEAALRSVTYENVSDAPTTTRTITFQADDGAPFSSLSDAVSRDVTITPVNDSPQVVASEGATEYTEGDPATTVDAAVTVTDPDDTNAEGGRALIASGFEAGDELVFVDQLGISGAYDTETGVLTLTGTASLADYETALRSIAFRQTSDNPTSGKSVEFQVNDGELDSSTGTKSIAITGVNDNPVVDTTDTALAYTEGDGAVAVDPALTATDPDSSHFASATVSITSGFAAAEDELAYTENPENGITAVYDDTTGVLTLSGAAFFDEYEAALRSVTYENSSDAPTAARTISFQVDDGSPTDNLSNVATRDVAITPANDAPVVTTSAGNTAYVIGDPAATVDAALTVSDVDDTSIEGGEVAIASGFEVGDSLVFVDQNGISGVYNTVTGVLTLTGTASLADYQTALRSVGYSYVGASTSGARSVEFTVTDGDAESAPAAKAVDVSSPPPPP